MMVFTESFQQINWDCKEKFRPFEIIEKGKGKVCVTSVENNKNNELLNFVFFSRSEKSFKDEKPDCSCMTLFQAFDKLLIISFLGKNRRKATCRKFT